MHLVLGEYFGFEYSNAVKIFMVGFAAIALIAALFVRLSLIQWIIAGTLFFNCLTAPLNAERTARLPTWMLPVQMYRAEAHLALGILLTVIVFATGRAQINRIPGQGLFVLAIVLFSGLMQFIHLPSEAPYTLGFAFATIPCMLFACPSMCNSYEACLKLLRTIMVVSVAWTVCCSVQFIINPKLLVNGTGRFWGMTANAQGAAMLVAPFAITALWLLLHDPNKKLRLLWVGLVGINLLFVGWTGSRTGLLMTVTGALFILYNRLGKVVLLLPFAALMTIGLSFLAEELQIGKNLERIVSTEDTRHGVWARQLYMISESPIIGVGWEETNASESSYLAGFASYGIGMFALMVCFLFFSIWKCAKITVQRRRIPKQQRPLIEMFCSYSAMYFVAGFFEGIILARSAPTQTMMLMFAGIGTWLSSAIANPDASEVYEEYESDLYGPETDPALAYDYTYGAQDGPPESLPGAQPAA